MNDITIEPIPNKVFGAVVTNIRLAELGDSDFETIKGTFLKYGFLVFPGQFLSDDENITFGKRFGKLEFGQENYKIKQNDVIFPRIEVEEVPEFPLNLRVGKITNVERIIDQAQKYQKFV